MSGKSGEIVVVISWLERKLRRQLNSARPTASEEWIADAHVAGGAQRKAPRPHLAISVDSKTLLARVCNEKW